LVMFSNMSVPPYRAGWGDSQAEGLGPRPSPVAAIRFCPGRRGRRGSLVRWFPGIAANGTFAVRPHLAGGKRGVGWLGTRRGGAAIATGSNPPRNREMFMIRIELTTDEQLLLGQVLERRIRDLELEILHTERSEFRAALKERMALLRAILERVKYPEAALVA
jgi:hypothetical protein